MARQQDTGGVKGRGTYTHTHTLREGAAEHTHSTFSARCTLIKFLNYVGLIHTHTHTEKRRVAHRQRGMLGREGRGRW